MTDNWSNENADETWSCLCSSKYIHRYNYSKIWFSKFVLDDHVLIGSIQHCLDRRFLIANSQLANKPIIYCNDAFCGLIGHSRADIIQKPCTCEFLYGQETSEKAAKQIRHALQGSDEKEVEIVLYKNNGNWLLLTNSKRERKRRLVSDHLHLGMKFRCSVLIAPVKNESCEIILYILEFTENSDRNPQRRMRRCLFSIHPLMQCLFFFSKNSTVFSQSKK